MEKRAVLPRLLLPRLWARISCAECVSPSLVLSLSMLLCLLLSCGVYSVTPGVQPILCREQLLGPLRKDSTIPDTGTELLGKLQTDKVHIRQACLFQFKGAPRIWTRRHLGNLQVPLVVYMLWRTRTPTHNAHTLRQQRSTWRVALDSSFKFEHQVLIRISELRHSWG